MIWMWFTQLDQPVAVGTKSEDLQGQKYRKLAKNIANWPKLEFSKCAKKKFDPYISPMMITDPQMHETPPKKAEEHPKKGRIWPKMAKNGKMQFSQNPAIAGFCKFFWWLLTHFPPQKR